MDTKQTLLQEETAARVIREMDRAVGRRSGNWDSHYTQVAEKFLPNDRYLFQSMGSNTSQGEQRNIELYDSTGTTSLNRFTSIMDSLVTPKNQTYHELTADPYLMKSRRARLWYEDTNRKLLQQRYISRANFSGQNQLVYESLGAYGTGALFIDSLAGEKGFRYKHIHLSQVFFAENHQGIIDTAYRRYSMTGRQLHQKWGDKLPESVKDKNKTNPEIDYEMIHCVEPAGDDYDPNRKDYRGMKFRSYYVLRSEKALLEKGGYVAFPYAITRWKQSANEVYGRSIAMDVLPTMKTLNSQQRTVLKQGQRISDPVLMSHDDGVGDGFSLRPGAMNAGYVNKDGRPLVHMLPTGNIAVNQEMIQDGRMIVKDEFLVRLFQMLEDNPQMTATEVIERIKQQGIIVAPTVGRVESEYVATIIEREISIGMMPDQNMFDPIPPEIIEAGGIYTIRHTSPISRAARAEEAAGTVRVVETAINISTTSQNPDILDHFDWDVIVPELADINGMPLKYRRSIEEIEKIREQRNAQAQQAQAIQAAPNAAALMKAGAEVKKVGGI